MTRTLTITAAEWASVQDGTLWLVREGREFYDMATRLYHPSLPPVEFTLACAPCETCDGDCRLVNLGRFGPPYAPCPDCRIELVRPCLSGCDGWGVIFCGDDDDIGDACDGECEGNGTVTLGHAYAVGQPLPIPPMPDHMADESSYTCDWGHCSEHTVTWRWAFDLHEWLSVCEDHAAQVGPPATLVGKWAQQLAVQP